MKVKTYKYESLQEGLENIKRDLGDDALILSTRSVSVRKRFGLFKKPGWEITAAAGETGPAETEKPKEKPARQSGAGSPLSILPANTVELADKSILGLNMRSAPGLAAAAAAPARDERMDTLIDEISELKKSFRRLSKAIPSKSDQADGLLAELVSQGIDHELAENLLTTASRGNPAAVELRDRVRQLIADRLLIAAPAELQGRTRMVTVFIGATGVGKTTTIAKIAGHAAIRKKKKVALISTDMFRIAGQEQLMRFGDLLGIPTYSCADVSSLKELIENLEDRDLILIDTPGSSPSDLARLSKLESVRSAADARVHLVISATTRSEDITKIMMRFEPFKPNSVIFTKIDETDSKGPLTADLLRNQIPVSYVTNGQRVPDDLMIPNAIDLARSVLPVEPGI